MKQFLLSFLLTSLSTSILVLLLSLIFTLFKTRISARAKYFIWFLVLLSFLLPFRPQFGSGLIRMNTSPTVETAVSSVQSATSQGASQVSTEVAQTGLWDTILSLPWFEILLFIWLLGFDLNLSPTTSGSCGVLYRNRLRKRFQRFTRIEAAKPTIEKIDRDRKSVV